MTSFDPIGDRRSALVGLTDLGQVRQQFVPNLKTQQLDRRRLAPPPPGFFGRFVQGLGVPEDLMIRTVGNIVSDDPKWDFEHAFGDPEEQYSFVRLLAESGAPLPIAIALGVGASILNPLDPLNKLKIARHTDIGLTASKADEVRAAGNLIKNSDGLYVQNVGRIDDEIARYAKLVEATRDTPAVNAAKKNLRAAQQAKIDAKEFNKRLLAYQKNGGDVAELTLKKTSPDGQLVDKTYYEQAREGYRRFLGMTSPFRPDHVPVPFPAWMNVKRSYFDQASRSVAFGGMTNTRMAGLKTVDDLAVLGAETAYKGMKKAGSWAGNKLSNVRLGWRLARTDNEKKVTQAINKGIGEVIRSGENSYAQQGAFRGMLQTLLKHGHTEDEILRAMHAARDLIEEGGEFAQQEIAALRFLEEEVNKSQVRSGGRFVSEVDPEAQVDQLMVDRIQTTKHSREHYRRVLAAEDLTDLEADEAVSLWSTSASAKEVYAGHQVLRAGRYVMLADSNGGKLSGDLMMSEAQQAAFRGIDVTPRWKKMTAPDGTEVMVAKRLPMSEIPMDPRNPQLGGLRFQSGHLDNLEVAAAQLSERGMAIEGPLELGDFLINEHYGIQIINPSKIVPVGKGSKSRRMVEARTLSESTLKEFAARHRIPHYGGGEFYWLQSSKRAKEAAARGRDAYMIRSDATVVKEARKGATFRAEPLSLLDAAANLTPLRQFLYGILESSQGDVMRGVDELKHYFGDRNLTALSDEVSHWVREIQSAENGKIKLPKIMFGMSDDGLFQITHGGAALMAAALTGLKSVRVQRNPVMVREALGEAEHVLMARRQLGEAITSNPERMASWGNEDLVQQGILSDSYKLFQQNNHIVRPNRDAIRTDGDLLRGFGDMFSMAANTQEQAMRVARSGSNALIDMVLGRYGGSEMATARLANLAAFAENHLDFAAKVEAELGLESGSLAKIFKDRRAGQTARDMFVTRMQPRAMAYVEALAENGVLSDEAIQAGLWRKTPAIVEYHDWRTQSYHIMAQGLDTNRLHEIAKRRLDDAISIEKFVPYAKVVAHGSDRAPEVRTIREIVGPTPVETATGGVQFSTHTVIDDETVQFLKEQGVLVLPRYGEGAPAELKKMISDGLLLIDKSKHLPKYDRPIRTGFTSGDRVFIGIGETHDDIQNTVRAVYGDGFNSVEEWFEIHANGVDVHYPALGAINKIGRNEVTRLQRRMKLLADHLERAGFRGDMKLRVQTGLGDEIDKALGIRDASIKQLTAKGDKAFKIVIPDRLKGRTIDTFKLGPHRVVKSMLGADDALMQAKIAKFVQDQLQHLASEEERLMFIRDFENKFPHQMRDRYFPRIMNPEVADAVRAQKALDAHAAALFREFDQTILRGKGDYLRDRSVLELTTGQFNNLVREVRKHKAGHPNLKANDLLGWLYQTAKGKGDEHAVIAIADLLDAVNLPLETGFFIENSLLALAHRTMQSLGDRMRMSIVKSLKEMGVGTVITPQTHKAILNKMSERKTLVEVIGQKKTQIKQLREQAQRIDDFEKLAQTRTGEAGRILDEMNRVKKELDAKNLELFSTDEFLKDFGPLQDIDRVMNVGWVSGATARRLYNSKALSDADILSEAITDPLVAIPIQKVINKMGNHDEILWISPDAARALENFFNMRRPGGWDRLVRGYDKALAAWKSVTLFPIPAYHGRNWVTNFILGHIGDVQPDNYRESARVAKLLKSRANDLTSFEDAMQTLDEMDVWTQGGERVSMLELWNDFVESGGITSGIHYAEFGAARGGKLKEVNREIEKLTGALPSSDVFVRTATWPVRRGRQHATDTETFFRFAAYLDGFKKTGSKEYAATNFKKLFYDYSDLNLFERNVLRRVLPFYAWSRFNIPRMFYAMLARPDVHLRVAKWSEQIQFAANDGFPIDERGMPDWMKEQFGIVVSKDSNGIYRTRMLGGSVPTFDALTVVTRPFDAALAMVTPLLKIPVEQLANYNFMTGRPIEEFPGEVSTRPGWNQIGVTNRATTEGPLGVLNLLLNTSMVEGLFRPSREVQRTAEYGADLVQKVFDPDEYKDVGSGFMNLMIDLLIGRSYEYNPELGLRWFHMRHRQNIANLNRAIKKAQAEGDERNASLLAQRRAYFLLTYQGEQEEDE